MFIINVESVIKLISFR